MAQGNNPADNKCRKCRYFRWHPVTGRLLDAWAGKYPQGRPLPAPDGDKAPFTAICLKKVWSNHLRIHPDAVLTDEKGCRDFVEIIIPFPKTTKVAEDCTDIYETRR